MIFILFLLNPLSTSLFIPYHKTETPILLQFDNDELSITKNLFRPFIVLVISDYSRMNNNKAIDIMSQMSLEFREKVLIGMMHDSTASQIYDDIQKYFNDTDQFIRPPFIIYYNAGRPVYVTSFINDEVAIAHTINFWINGPKSVSNFNELVQALGNTPLSILSKKSVIKEAFNITNKALRIAGPIELIQVEDKLFETINLSEYNFSVFVNDDNSINGFKNYDEFIEFGRPHFKVFQKNDITSNIYVDQENDIVAIFDTDLKLEYNNTLYDLKDRYSQFSYGIVNEKSLFSEYSLYTNREIKNMPSFLIFNAEHKFYYPLPENLNNEQNATLLLNEYVKLVAEGQIQRVYMIEELNESLSDNNKEITRLNGKNFENFVNDTQKDTLIFFETPENWPYYFKFFENAQKNISSLGLNIKFGFIDPNKNSSPYRFPKIYSNPLIGLYLKDGTMIPMLNIVNEEGILRFLHFFASDGNLIPSTNFTKSQARTERYRISSVYYHFYDDYIDIFNAMFENIDNPSRIS